MRQFTFGYARVSTEQQNLDRQLDMLKSYGVDVIYNEKMTGTKKDRPELNKLLERMTAGDIDMMADEGYTTDEIEELLYCRVF